MATQTIVRLVDDISGADADETVRFEYKGTAYTIDLSEANAAKLRKILAPYIAAGTRLRGTARTAAKTTQQPTDPGRNALIREWAKQNGHDVADQGRVPRSVVEAYEQRRRA